MPTYSLPAVFPEGAMGSDWCEPGEVCLCVCVFVCTHEPSQTLVRWYPCSHTLESEKWTSWPTFQLKGQKTVGLLCSTFSPPRVLFPCAFSYESQWKPEHQENSCSHGVSKLPHKGGLDFPQLSWTHTMLIRLCLCSHLGGLWPALNFTNLPDSSPLGIVTGP